jgi:hypothetical protein
MARDLIPPPSPAGRPSPDPPAELPAGPVTEPGAVEAPPPRSSGPSPFRNRFGFVAGALLGVGVCAAIAFALLLAAGPPADRIRFADHWSRWQPPTDDPAAGAAAIAGHVEPEYRRDTSHQLVDVVGGSLELDGVPISVNLRPGDGSLQDLGSKGVLYTLRGTGPHGEITTGKPSVERHALLRREALELALYSFRYLDGVDEVVTLLPPTNPKASGAGKKAKSQEQAVFYRAGDLRGELEIPLSNTLVPHRLTPDALTKGDLRHIDSLTLGNLFLASLQLAPDQRFYLLLARPRA